VTVPLAKHPDVKKLRVKQKWRPSLAMIIFAVLTTVLALPLVGLFFFRLYENALIRQTEAELVAQSAVLSALFAREIAGAADGGSATTPSPRNAVPDADRYTPIEPSLDLAGSAILGPRPGGLAGTSPSGRGPRIALPARSRLGSIGV
jgi:hypothetical protein